MYRWLAVMAGAAIGGLARHLAASAITFGGRLPLATFVINVTGCFGIGLLMPLLSQRGQTHQTLRLLLVVGFLGGYTTFSSFAWETFVAVRSGSRWIGLLYVTSSVVFGYLAVWMGAALSGRR